MKTLMAAEDETLYEHIDEAMHQYCKNFLSHGYGKFITNRLRRLSINFEDCGALIGLAILLHDSGKSHSQYQANLKKPLISHEAYSAVLAWNALLLGENEKKAVSSAILLHHEYMRLPEPRTITRDFEGYVGELISILRDISLKYGISRYLDLSKITTLSSCYTRDVIGNLNKGLKSSKQLYACTTLILHPLMICDNLSASLHRKGRFPRFLKDIEDPKITSDIRKYLRAIL